jgi:hypothetical protein
MHIVKRNDKIWGEYKDMFILSEEEENSFCRIDGLMFFDSFSEIINCYLNSADVKKETISNSVQEIFTRITPDFSSKSDLKKNFPEFLLF